jgi:zinc protease
VFSGFRYDRTPGPFVIAGSVRTDVTGASVPRSSRKWRHARQPLPAAELAGARDSQVLSLPGQFETNSDIGASLAETYVFDLPLDYYSPVSGAEADRSAVGDVRPERRVLAGMPDRPVVRGGGGDARVYPDHPGAIAGSADKAGDAGLVCGDSQRITGNTVMYGTLR